MRPRGNDRDLQSVRQSEVRSREKAMERGDIAALVGHPAHGRARKDPIDKSPIACRKSDIALNRYAVGSRPADRKVARASTCETPLLSAAFSMSALHPDSDQEAHMLACLKCANTRPSALT